MMDTLRSITRQFILFCGVGSINTITALTLILFLSEIIDLHYGLANFIGYIFGVILGFFLHRSITFKNDADRKYIKREFIRFSSIFVIAYLLQFGALIALVEIFGIWAWLSQILAIGFYTCINYLGNRVYTFQPSKGE